MKYLEGYKTYIAALLAALVAANGVLHVVPEHVQQVILAAAISLGFYGLRSAIGHRPKENEFPFV